ncbi:glycosyltransferase family 4 protein [uncultured Mucilaginibacter sp.]|uniref:glycosyltransferase family 4 protein n=1 Tax=uncultured Mucilaginibacter sp. TaxID=797541 RepID=UPI0026009ABA|nr:glycosyltransferase family 4 protein [uncultured Mucilaginibacter sp.]
MTVAYYTSTFFLDLSLDVINVLKQHVNLHVFIEVTTASKNATVANINELPANKLLAKPNEVLSIDALQKLAPYFEGTASTQFVIHSHPSGFSWSTIKASRAVYNFIKPFKPSAFYFEGYTLRTVGLLPYLLGIKKVFLTIHDPIPHTGEGSWKISVPNYMFFKLPLKRFFVFYSEFARQLFVKNYAGVTGEKLLIAMKPYSYFKLPSATEVNTEYILFFGRISAYKGVDVLLQAMQQVFEEYKNEKLIIAGKSANGFVIDDKHIGTNSNVEIINRYIDNDELVDLISRAKFIVCPYLDATQSGVLMTAFALNKTVIASDVGSFPEFITDNYNGLLVPPSNPALLATAIKRALKDDYYKILQANLLHQNNQTSWQNSFANLINNHLKHNE